MTSPAAEAIPFAQYSRNEWHFSGHVVSDCWALDDIWARHKVVATREEACAMAMKAGVNLNCGYIYQLSLLLSDLGLITEDEVNDQLSCFFDSASGWDYSTRIHLVPWSVFHLGSSDSPTNRALGKGGSSEINHPGQEQQ